MSQIQKQKPKQTDTRLDAISVDGKKHDVNSVCRQVRRSANVRGAVYYKTSGAGGGKTQMFMSRGEIVAVMSNGSIILVDTGNPVRMREPRHVRIARAKSLAQSMCGEWTELTAECMRDETISSFLNPADDGCLGEIYAMEDCHRKVSLLAAKMDDGSVSTITDAGVIAGINDMRKVVPAQADTPLSAPGSEEPSENSLFGTHNIPASSWAQFLQECRQQEIMFAIRDRRGSERRISNPMSKFDRMQNKTLTSPVSGDSVAQEDSVCSLACVAEMSDEVRETFSGILAEEKDAATAEYLKASASELDEQASLVQFYSEVMDDSPEELPVRGVHQPMAARSKSRSNRSPSSSADGRSGWGTLSRAKSKAGLGGKRTFDPSAIIAHARCPGTAPAARKQSAGGRAKKTAAGSRRHGSAMNANAAAIAECSKYVTESGIDSTESEFEYAYPDVESSIEETMVSLRSLERDSLKRLAADLRNSGCRGTEAKLAYRILGGRPARDSAGRPAGGHKNGAVDRLVKEYGAYVAESGMDLPLPEDSDYPDTHSSTVDVLASMRSLDTGSLRQLSSALESVDRKGTEAGLARTLLKSRGSGSGAGGKRGSHAGRSSHRTLPQDGRQGPVHSAMPAV